MYGQSQIIRRGLLRSERVRRHPVKQHQACVHNESGYVKFSRWNSLAVVTPWWRRSNDVSARRLSTVGDGGAPAIPDVGVR